MNNQDVPDLARVMDAQVSAAWHPGMVEAVSGAAVGSGFSSYDLRDPAMELIGKEEAASSEEAQEELRVRAETLRLVIFSIVGDGRRRPPLEEMGRAVAVYARDMGHPAFRGMTHDAIGKMAECLCPSCGEVVNKAMTRACVQATHKKYIQGPKQKAGQTGVLTSGQKSVATAAKLSEVQKNNKNRSNAARRKNVKLRNLEEIAI